MFMSSIASWLNAMLQPSVAVIARNRVNQPTGLVVSSDGMRWRCMWKKVAWTGAQNLIDVEDDVEEADRKKGEIGQKSAVFMILRRFATGKS